MAGRFERMTMNDRPSIAVYRAPPVGERRGGVVLVQEISGVTEHIRDMAERICPRQGARSLPALHAAAE